MSDFAVAAEIPREELYTYNNVDLAHDIANAIHPLIDRLVELRGLQGQLGEKEADQTFLIIPKANLSKNVELQLFAGRESKEMEITNGQALAGIEYEIGQKAEKVNDIFRAKEIYAEEQRFDELCDNPELFSNEETKRYTGRSLSYWKKLTPGSRSAYLSDYAENHPDSHVAGVRSAAITAYTLSPHSYAAISSQYTLEHAAPAVTVADFTA